MSSRFLIIFLLLLSGSTGLFAQEYPAAHGAQLNDDDQAFISPARSKTGTHFSLKIIPQNVWMYNKEDADNPNFKYEFTWKIAGSASVIYHFREKLGAGIEVIYSPQGQTHKDYNNFLYHVNTAYIKLPVLLDVNSNPQRKVMGYLQLGPQVAFLVSAKMTDGEDDLDVKDLYNKVYFGAALGVGTAFNVAKNTILAVGVRGDAGFSDAVNTGSDLMYLLSVNEQGERNPTYHFTGGVEVALKYVLRKDRKKVTLL